MLRSLRNRLILSHLLPLLIVLPLAGVAFIYVVETKVILPSLSDELMTEAGLIAELAGGEADIWQDQGQLNDLMERLTPQTKARVMFMDPNGKLLASSEPSDQSRLGVLLFDDDVIDVQRGEITQHIEYSQGLQAEIIDVFAPVYDTENHLIGMIRMSYPYMTIADELVQVRFIILGVLAFALVAGIGLGSFLAVTINTPIKRVTEAIDELARGDKIESVDPHGPEEIQSLVRSTNSLFERLQQLEKARKQLLANLVHEIGRPLGALRSAIQSLKLGAGEDPQLLEDLTTGMDAETSRLQRLLNELAHLHDQVFGSLELERQTVSAQTWITTVLRPWEAAARKKNLDWTLEIPDDLPDFQADPFRLAQAVENLVSNAIKYTPGGGAVAISLGQESETLWIKVCDTGLGIAPEEQAKIFAPFYRGEQKRRIKQGMGLGLSITQDVILAHGGEISLSSKQGEGSCFIIWLPLV